MVKAVVTTQINPGFEDLLFESLEKAPEVVEAHLSSHNNSCFIFVSTKDLNQLENYVEKLRMTREINIVNNAYVVREVKCCQGRMNKKRIAFVFSSMTAGNESVALDGVKKLPETRDVFCLTGGSDLLITTEVDSVYEMAQVELGISKNVRHIESTISYLTKRSLVKD